MSSSGYKPSADTLSIRVVVAARIPVVATSPVVEAAKPDAAKKQEAFMKVRLSRKKALFVIVPNYGTSTQTA